VPFSDAAHSEDAAQGHLLLQQASSFVHEQKQLIRRRQVAMQKAREEWHKSADVLRWVRPSTQRDRLVHMLKQVHMPCQTCMVKERTHFNNCLSHTCSYHCSHFCSCDSRLKDQLMLSSRYPCCFHKRTLAQVARPTEAKMFHVDCPEHGTACVSSYFEICYIRDRDE
jgi:hypothetical protein